MEIPKTRPSILPDTPLGKELAVKLAVRTGCYYKTGVMLGISSKNTLILHKKVCASNLVWTQEVSYPLIITMKQPPASIEKFYIPCNNDAKPKWLISKELLDEPLVDNLQNCDVIIACGVGIGSKEACEKARQLASMLSAGFGLTRTAVLNGWGSSAEILGQSGVSVAPKLCLALGISGAFAFMSGVETAENIILITRLNFAFISSRFAMFSSIEVVLRYMSYAIFRRGINSG